MEPARPSSSAGLWLLLLGGAAAALAFLAWPAHGPGPAPRDSAADGAAAFDAAAAFEDLRAIVALGPRTHGSPGLAACQALIERRLREAGTGVRVDAFEYTGVSGRPARFKNLFGHFGPEGAPPVWIGTHPDTQARCHNDPDPAKRDRPVPGANDGGSGVAVLLELARCFRRAPPPVPVVLACFDGEDYGGPGELGRDYLVGSRRAAETLPDDPAARPRAVVIVDLVAERAAEFPRRSDFQAGAPGLADAVWGAAARAGAAAFFSDRLAYALSDDHSAFLARGVPALVVIDYEYGPGNAWWHSTADTLDKCDAVTLGAVGRTLLEWVRAGAPLTK